MYYYMVDVFSIFQNMTNIYNNYQQDFIDLVMKSPCLLKVFYLRLRVLSHFLKIVTQAVN